MLCKINAKVVKDGVEGLPLQFVRHVNTPFPGSSHHEANALWGLSWLIHQDSLQNADRLPWAAYRPLARTIHEELLQRVGTAHWS